MHQFDLKNKTAIITGGAQGFGLDIAKRFLKSGAKVIIWDIDEKELKNAVNIVNDSNLSYSVVDVSNFKNVKETVNEITKSSNIDVLINNAGITGSTSSLWDYDVDDLGYKYNGNSVSAAMAITALKYLDEDNQKRGYISDCYSAAIERTDTIELIEHDKNIISSRHLCQIVVDQRDEFVDYMSNLGISCGVHYKPNNRLNIYKKFDRGNLIFGCAL